MFSFSKVSGGQMGMLKCDELNNANNAIPMASETENLALIPSCCISARFTKYIYYI